MSVTHAWRQRAIVRSGGIIEIHTPELAPGTEAEVIVLVEDQLQEPSPLTDLIGIGRGVYGTADEIDAYLNRLRDEKESP